MAGESHDEVRALATQVDELVERPGSSADLSLASALTDDLGAARAALTEQLTGAETLSARDAGARCEDLTRLTELQASLLEHTVTLRLRALARIHASLARLRTCSTVAELLPATARELAMCCDFDRVSVSRLRGSTWRSEAVWIPPDLGPELAVTAEAYLTTHWMPLGPGALETDLIRRRAAAVITADDPRMNHEWVEVTGTTGYVASPVMPAGKVIGFLQADCYGSQRTLTAHDRDNMWTFAEGFGLIYERTVLLERLAAQRTRAREAFELAERQFEELALEEIRLEHAAGDPAPIAARAADLFRPPPAVSAGPDALTAREAEVLTLMATGARNGEIADRLVISEATVKSHVRNVLRKIGAANRADAVSRHLQLARKERG
jgi:DNA-binding CsgD family transcriptional regulator